MKKLVMILFIAFATMMISYMGLFIFGYTPLIDNQTWGYGHHHVGFPGLFMGAFWILVIGGLLLYFWDGPRLFHRSTQSLSILNERYARGEIDKETYQQMKRTLEDN